MDKAKSEILKSTSLIAPGGGGSSLSPFQNGLFGTRFSTPVFDKPDDQGVAPSGDGGEDNDGDSNDQEGSSNDTGGNQDDIAAQLEDLKQQLADATALNQKVTTESVKRKKQIKELKDQIDSAEGSKTDLMTKLEELLGEEITVDTINEQIETKKRAEEEALKKSGDYEALHKRMTSEHQKTIDALNGKYGSELKSKNEALEAANKTIRQLLVTNSFASSKYVSDDLVLSPKMAEKLYGDNFKIEERGGVSSVVAYNGSEPLVDGDGNPLPFEKALAEIIESDPDKDSVIRSKAKSGSGSSASGAPVSKPSPTVAPGTGRITAALNANGSK